MCRRWGGEREASDLNSSPVAGNELEGPGEETGTQSRASWGLSDGETGEAEKKGAE